MHESTRNRNYSWGKLSPEPSTGRGILVVEHDMALVRQVCAHIYMLMSKIG
jgi:ABC-type uncharacterized transport system ATPase subunit